MNFAAGVFIRRQRQRAGGLRVSPHSRPLAEI
jgi:hypothetical protein